MKAILTYHSIDDSQSVISMDAGTFRRQVEGLCAADVPVLPLSDLVRSECSSGVALTFDDGFRNFADQAWPVLRGLGLPATVFVVSGHVGRANDWDREDSRIPRLPLMDWATLEDLAGQGVELGGHTHTHADLSELPYADVQSEIEANRDAITQATGVTPRAFAYPYGRYTDDAVTAVGSAGYDLAVTTDMDVLDRESKQLVLPRLDAFYFRHSGALARWGTAHLRRYVRLRAGVRQVRDALTRAGLVR